MRHTQLIVGNWKMNGTIAGARKLASTIVEGARGKPATVVLCPPFTLIRDVADVTRGVATVVGGQDCHSAAKGAYTGDISAEMLRDLACEYVIVGHSERRNGHGETSAQVKAKAEAAQQAELKTIICVGETLEERKSGAHQASVRRQIEESIPAAASAENTVIAYEPVWAIGTGEVATLEDIAEMHRYIKTLIPGNIYVIYGGSVKAASAYEILALPEVDGVLVGGASLEPKEFLAIIAASVRT